MKLKVKMLKDEFWYGGDTNIGFFTPLSKKSVYLHSNVIVRSYGQSNTLWLSNKGRVIWSDKGFTTKFFLGNITCTSEKAEIELFEAEDKTLKGAYLYAVEHFMKPDGKHPNPVMFTIPQYCTWIQFEHNQTQDNILSYAKSILDNGMPAGELIIDDGWQTNFGEWDFDKNKFANPKEMCEQLHSLGFKIILWICPFISQKSVHFEYLSQNNLLVKDCDGNIAFRKWWNGQDAVLDLSNPLAMNWFTDYAKKLIDEFGVDGFKQDAGDAMYYKDDDITFGKVDANTQSKLWAQSAINFDYNELRACFQFGCKGVAQRLADKSHKWGILGLGALLPNTLTQGITGYAFGCPDMIGGGQMGDFVGKDKMNLDHELFMRYAQASCLMPMMQFSLDIWNINEQIRNVCLNCIELHQKYADYIINLAKHASVTGEPIVRYMEYCFPNKGYGKLTSQFMLGDDIIVAPVLSQGHTTKKVYIPDGKWQYKDKIYSNEVAIIPAPIDELVYLTKVKD